MEVLSSARSTILSGFQNLETICSYEGSQNDSVDFNFFSGTNIFTQTNKKNRLEFLQIRNNNAAVSSNISNSSKNGTFDIHRIRKMKIENLHCVAPLKAYEIALGMSNGEIRVLNYKSNEYISKFSAETSKHSVISLDYSSLDECLACVYENGSINIYGMKTKAKLETLNFDGNCRIAKFSPKKKFRLAIASHKGSIFLYDIQSHRKIFQAIDAHSAPCRDVATAADQPDLLYSAGYDSIINIYDVKKKARTQQIQFRYPLSTISVSDCGTYCVAGNLKGELISHDLRFLKKPLVERKMHDSTVIRVAFVPSTFKKQSSAFSSQIETNESHENNRMSTMSNFNNEQLIEQDNKNRDSFYDYMEFQSLHTVNQNSNINPSKKLRESFDWDQLGTVRRENERRLSSKMSLGLIKKRLTEDNCTSNHISSDEFSMRNKNGLSDTPNFTEGKLMSYSKILEEDDEENLFDENNKNQENKNVSITPKESMNVFLNAPNKNTRSSTPNNLETDEFQELNNVNTRRRENTGINIEILNQIKELRLDVEKKFEYLENEIKFNAESNKWNLYTQNCNFWNKQYQVNNDMCEALDIILHSDDFYQDYCRIKEENEQLKLTIEKLNKNNCI
ncbi:uncharacterized protein LOC129607636 [Condylostylus longicornis]|uniref:uncharacterized protein LOC129607636 n=1 Tax=Condylostylus longicornis TaxID=2530218 RepID=UPI00244E3138|nr:uncharacterized protein LOC129607636 [Condylostylus longicornis]